ncbi:MAG: alpha/beta fold hydrolase [Solirubrobacteraceae bacterium]
MHPAWDSAGGQRASDSPPVSLAYDRVGHGPPLVLLHSLGADRRVWDPILEPLAQDREVLAVDLPGFGESPPLSHTPTPSALAHAVAEFLAGLGLSRPHVAGNSLGGWVALELGLAGHARSVTAIAPAGLWPQPLMPKRGIARGIARAALPLLDRMAASERGRRLILTGSVAHPERVPAQDAAHLVRAYALAPGFRAANDAMRSARFEGLERIRVPVTLVWPEHDRLVERPTWLPLGVHSRTLEDAGHLPMWDAPAALSRLLVRTSAGASSTLNRSP